MMTGILVIVIVIITTIVIIILETIVILLLSVLLLTFKTRSLEAGAFDIPCMTYLMNNYRHAGLMASVTSDDSGGEV